MAHTKALSEWLFGLCSIICGIIGITKVVLGILRLNNLRGFLENLEDVHVTVIGTTLLLMAVGVTLIVVSAFGFGSIMIDRSCWVVGMVAIILLILFAIQIWFISNTFKQLNDGTIRQSFYESLQKLYRNDTQLANITIDYIQNNLKCCGINGPTYEASLPDSCCSSYANDICIPFEQGCWPELYNFISGSTRTMAIIIGVFASIEVVGAGLAIHVMRRKWKQEQ